MNSQRLEYCRKCQRITIHFGHSTNHLLHLLITFISYGLWIPVWLTTHIRNECSFSCSKCHELDRVYKSNGEYYNFGKKLALFLSNKRSELS